MRTNSLQSSDEKQRDIFVIYCDLVGSTRTVKNLKPRQIRRYYTIFLNEMTNVINDFGGRILKYVGDCIIGLFILPEIGWIPYVDNAVLCSKMMMKVMKYSIDPIAQSEGLPSMSCRIGADIGEVQVIKVGVEDIYTNIDVFGNVMNITSKICGKAVAEEILFGKNLWNLIYISHKLKCKNTKTLDLNGISYKVYSLSYNS